MEDSSPCVYTLTAEGFLLKTREKVAKENILCQFDGQANSVLVGFDNFGRVLRVSGTEIEFTPIGTDGTYLPALFEASFQDDYKVLYMGICDGTRRMLVYRDGYIGFFDTEEWFEKKVVKFISRGVCTAVMDKLLEVYEEHEIPQCIVLADDTGKNVKVGIVKTDAIPIRSRTSRAKVFNGTDIDTKYIKGMSYIEAMTYINNPNKYMGKLMKISDTTFIGDPSELEDGKYLEYCKDFED
jgi:hypothetical protein